MIDITEKEAYAVAEIIDTYIFQIIRDDDSIDNISWLRNIICAYDKLCKIGKYKGINDPDSYYNEGEDDE